MKPYRIGTSFSDVLKKTQFYLCFIGSVCMVLRLVWDWYITVWNPYNDLRRFKKISRKCDICVNYVGSVRIFVYLCRIGTNLYRIGME